MCRLAAYVGVPVPLSSLLYEPPHSLERQAYLPQEMVSGHVNVDGTGIAWWHEGEVEPLRYVTERPPWSDDNLLSLGPRLRGSPLLAVVRSRTPGMPAGSSAVHPFVFDGWAGGHNGYLMGFDSVRWRLIDSVDSEVLRRLDALSDSAVLFLVAVTLLRRGASLAEALRDTVAKAARLCEEAGRPASLNLVLADAGEVVATRMARGVRANSLYHLEAGKRWPEGKLVASEPLDADGVWTAIAEDHLIRISAGETTVEPLGV